MGSQVELPSFAFEDSGSREVRAEVGGPCSAHPSLTGDLMETWEGPLPALGPQLGSMLSVPQFTVLHCQGNPRGWG